MTVDADDARAKGLTQEHAGREYAFCGEGCMLEFRDGAERFLDPAYQPQM